jgi:ligand-binding sensor protein
MDQIAIGVVFANGFIVAHGGILPFLVGLVHSISLRMGYILTKQVNTQKDSDTTNKTNNKQNRNTDKKKYKIHIESFLNDCSLFFRSIVAL